MKVSTISMKRLSMILGILLFTVGCDQSTKKIASMNLQGQPAISYWNDLFRFDYVENPGAFLSLGGNLSPTVRFWLLNVAVAVFLLVLLYSVITSRTMSRVQILSLTFVLGGGFSNLIDRFFRYNGQVIDFMNMGIGSLRTGVFNIADVFIMGGIIVFTLANFGIGQAARTDEGQA